MTPIEEARAYAHYFNFKVDEKIQDLVFGKPFRLPKVGSKEELNKYSDMIGPSSETIKKRIRLLFLTEHIQNMLENKQISLTVAESLVNLMAIQDPEERAIRMKSLAEKYVVTATERSPKQLDHEINTILENYWKGSKELQQKIEDEEKILKTSKK